MHFIDLKTCSKMIKLNSLRGGGRSEWSTGGMDNGKQNITAK
jgi:hypothetical protein